jgi:signal transduction histidine kinase
VAPEPHDLVGLARQVLNQCALLPERTAQHRRVLDAPAALMGTDDPAQIEQALTNLVTNALKYSPSGGEVRVGVRQQREQLELTVSDQGMGLAPQEQARLLQPFARGETVRRRGIAGLGLGLYITAQIVEQHGGTIRVHSQPGRGSVFTMRWPRVTRTG